MARREEHEKAIRLRKQGKSYSQIKAALGVGKGTLSAWLKGYPLSQARLKKLRDWNEARIEHYRETRQKKRAKILESIYQREKIRIGKLSLRDIFIGGLFLYWGEGSKTRMEYLQMANTDPGIVKAYIVWLEKTFGIAKSRLRIRLHLYRDMDISREMKFWSRILNIDLKFFKKPYIKKSAAAKLTYKGGFGHGTCNVLLFDANVAKRVLMSVRVLRDFFLGQSFNGEDGALIKH